MRNSDRPASPQQKVYASCGFGVDIKFSFLNFLQPRGTKTCFENRSRHKLKRYGQGGESVFDFR